jgi:FtsH-binding integral membrane protein
MRNSTAYAMEDTYGEGLNTAYNSPAAARAGFIRNVYGHVFGAVLAFVALEVVLFKSGVADSILQALFAGGGGKMAMILLMVLFIGGGYAAQMMAHAPSKAMQYAGLGGYVVLEAMIFLPILYVAEVRFAGQHLPLQAGLMTLLVFGGLTTVAFVSGKDFSFLGPILGILSMAALGLVIASMIFGFSLGLVFSVAMVVLAAGMMVYQTSAIMHQYGTDQYVGAALGLFASLATMFFYVLRILMSLSGRND